MKKAWKVKKPMTQKQQQIKKEEQKRTQKNQ